MIDNLTERERGLINNCLQYAQTNPAGLPGHNLMILVAKLAMAYEELVQENGRLKEQIRTSAEAVEQQ